MESRYKKGDKVFFITHSISAESAWEPYVTWGVIVNVAERVAAVKELGMSNITTILPLEKLYPTEKAAKRVFNKEFASIGKDTNN